MIVVAGHLCLDVIPAIPGEAVLEPGALIEVGPVSYSPGGAVGNVGSVLARLGLAPSLVGRIGDDAHGEILRASLSRRVAPSASDAPLTGITRVSGETTSYTIVINPPGRDRTFLHHAGCNELLTASDLQAESWRRADLLHFGYPPLMKGVYGDGGRGLALAFRRLREHGVTVSLDMAMPDPGGSSGRVDWRSFLDTVLPHVDLFLPSWQETCAMVTPGRPAGAPSPAKLARLAERLLERGPAIVGLKLGADGFYLRSSTPERLARAGRSAPGRDWADRELLSPNYKVEAGGTTGAGDATIAGLLAALAFGLPAEEGISTASAVGACSVQGADAVGAVLSWQETRERLARGWPRSASAVTAAAEAEGSESAGAGPSDSRQWRLHSASGVLLGPNDRG